MASWFLTVNTGGSFDANESMISFSIYFLVVFLLILQQFTGWALFCIKTGQLRLLSERLTMETGFPGGWISFDSCVSRWGSHCEELYIQLFPFEEREGLWGQIWKHRPALGMEGAARGGSCLPLLCKSVLAAWKGAPLSMASHGSSVCKGIHIIDN